jgi:hypothetical protein
MNLKKAKMLRHVAGYRNQSATPGTMPFPGVARMYKVPVYSKRTYTRRDGTEVTKMVLAGNKPVMEMDIIPPGREPTEFDDDGKPTAYNTETIIRPKYELLPVSKPGRLDSKQPKGVYRQLKKMFKRGTLQQIGPIARAIASQMEVTQ